MPAKLIVRLTTGEEWEATTADLLHFGAADRLDLYGRFKDLLVEGLGLEPGTDLTREEAHEGANLVRYLVECALMYDHSPWADELGEPWPEDGDDEREDFRERLRGYLLRDPVVARSVVLRLLEGWTPFVDRADLAKLGVWQSDHGARADQDMTRAERDLVAELLRQVRS